jgi:peptide chain release factor 2
MYDQQIRAISDAEVLLELAEEAGDTASAREAEAQAAHVRKQLDEIEFKRMLSGELDHNGAIVSVQSGAGGVDCSATARSTAGRPRSSTRRRRKRPASRARRSA